MTISVLAALVIVFALPISFVFVNLISIAYEVRDADAKELQHYVQHKQRYLNYFAKN